MEADKRMTYNKGRPEEEQKALAKSVTTPERQQAAQAAADLHYGPRRIGSSPEAFMIGYMYAMRDAEGGSVEQEKQEDEYEPREEDFAEAQKLIDQGFCQISAAYRTLACLPLGKTAHELMSELDPQGYNDRIERAARSQYLRCHQIYEEPSGKNRVNVSPRVFRAFKKLNGEVA